ncbi:hypothetical protein CMI47_01945 [Candidatus Pacearchaeota archaeon]|jgi:lipopolysaccharide biosynthesis glycosyltransferase|nr:hypothetical protein [Candidatus Pacearchaeota archaeon]|tara:strand:- start:4601 stop:5407 length:807 start_codon:yes stop_codon:yes gene_type:complete
MKTCFVTCALKNHFPGLEKLALSLNPTLEKTNSDFCVISPDEVDLNGVKYFQSYPKDSTYEGIKIHKHKHYDLTRWHPVVWYKFEAFGMRGYDRVIYLDSDMLVLDDISELATDHKYYSRPVWFSLNSDEEDSVSDEVFYNPLLRKRIVSYRRTVSTGIMIINIDQISKITRQSLIYLAELGKTYDGADQGVINQWIEEKEINFGVLEDKYNHLAINQINDETKIIHYFGHKPWESESEVETIISDISESRDVNNKIWLDFSGEKVKI